MKNSTLKRTGFKKKTYQEAVLAQSKRRRISKKIPTRRRVKDNDSKPRKKKKERVEYRNLRLEFLQAHPVCQCVDKDGVACSRMASDVHHTAGRYHNLCNVDTWMAVCREHHNFIHDNGAWAKERGYLLNKASQHKLLEISKAEEQGNQF